MQGSKEKENVLKYKLAYSGIVLLVYIIGKNIPLYGIDLSSYKQVTFRAEELLTQTISGDIYRSYQLNLSVYDIRTAGSAFSGSSESVYQNPGSSGKNQRYHRFGDTWDRGASGGSPGSKAEFCSKQRAAASDTDHCHAGDGDGSNAHSVDFRQKQPVRCGGKNRVYPG